MIVTNENAGTLTEVEPLTAPEVAVIAAVPSPIAVTRPLVVPVLLTDATAGFELLHTAELVTFCWVPSARVAAAVNCCCAPGRNVAPDGETAMEPRGDITVNLRSELTDDPPTVTEIKPLVAPLGTLTVSVVAVAAVTVAAMPLNRTELELGVVLKPCPWMVTV